MTTLEVHELYKSFSSKESLTLDVLKILRRYREKHTPIPKRQVLKGLSFSLGKGEVLGIMGRNGSGKSTLLRILAGILRPDKGQITSQGGISYLPALSAGINPQLTMRDSIFLSGILRGLSRETISRNFNDIVEFSELGDYLDEQVSHFSSGMRARLAFSTTIHFTLAQEAEILLLDEVFSGGGDKAFKEKALDKFKELFNRQMTIIFVSHNGPLIRKYCTQAFVLENGTIHFSGSPEEASETYNQLFR
jgi:ABC-type polysaccharide/polyol phosphate transport system ATPase subunit